MLNHFGATLLVLQSDLLERIKRLVDDLVGAELEDEVGTFDTAGAARRGESLHGNIFTLSVKRGS